MVEEPEVGRDLAAVQVAAVGIAGLRQAGEEVLERSRDGGIRGRLAGRGRGSGA